MVEHAYHIDVGLKVAIEDGEIIRDLLEAFQSGLPPTDSPEDQVLSLWNRWQTKVTKHLLPEHQKTFLALRRPLPQPLTLKSLRKHISNCVANQNRYLLSLIEQSASN